MYFLNNIQVNSFFEMIEKEIKTKVLVYTYDELKPEYKLLIEKAKAMPA